MSRRSGHQRAHRRSAVERTVEALEAFAEPRAASSWINQYGDAGSFARDGLATLRKVYEATQRAK